MRKKVKGLEHHPDLAPDRINITQVSCQLNAIDNNSPLLVLLKPIDCPNKSRLA